jgi:hypothetical protein
VHDLENLVPLSNYNALDHDDANWKALGSPMTRRRRIEVFGHIKLLNL